MGVTDGDQVESRAGREGGMGSKREREEKGGASPIQAWAI
jgi:hypothetical protein